MKWSKYNFLFKSDKHDYLLYNSFSNSFIELEKELYHILKEVEQGKHEIEKVLEQDDIKELKKQGIIINFPEEQLLDIKLKTHINRYQKDNLIITIAPTLKCNFICSYCYEEGIEQSEMDDANVEKLKTFLIEKSKQSKSLNICWYGGEPLIAFDKIKEITSVAKECFENYNASIITNGYLLSKEKSEAFKSLNINQVQITLDGPKEIHDKRRILKSGKGTFDKIFSNIEELFLVNSEVRVSVRVNIDDENESKYFEIYNYLKLKFANNKLNIYPGFVKNTSKGCKSIEDEHFDHQRKADFQVKNFNKHAVITNFYPTARFNECTARCLNGFLIDPKGDLYKCWEDIGDENYKIGNVESNHIDNKEVLVNYLTGEDYIEDKECLDCKIMPICNGGCPKDRILNKIKKNMIDTCHPMKNNVESFLDIYYQIKKEKSI